MRRFPTCHLSQTSSLSVVVPKRPHAPANNDEEGGPGMLSNADLVQKFPKTRHKRYAMAKPATASGSGNVNGMG